MNEINLWYARDKVKDEIVIANNANNKDDYVCPICLSKVIPRGLKENSKVVPHFYHIDKTKCSSESMIHWWFKNKFIEIGDTFSIEIKDKDKKYTCISLDVEKTYNVNGKMYRPDVTINCEDGSIVLFEFKNTNGKKFSEYIEIWRSLGHPVVEIDIKNVLNSNKTFKPLYYNNRLYVRHKYSRKTDGYIKRKDICNDDLDRIKNIDWFFIDLNNYMNGKISALDLNNTIEELICGEDKDLVFDVMCSKPCFSTNNKFANEMLDEIIKVNQDILLELENDFGVKATLQVGTDTFYKKQNRKIISVYGFKHKFNYCVDVLNDNLFNSIAKILEMVKKDSKLEKDLKAAQNNEIIQNVIRDICKIYKEVNSGYNIYTRFGEYGTFITFSFNHNSVLDIRVSSEDIIYEKEYDKIFKFIFEKTDRYMKSIEKIVNVSKLKNVIEKLNKIYRSIYILDKSHYMGGLHRFGISYRDLSEETMKITLYKERFNGSTQDILNIMYDKNKIGDTCYDLESLYKCKFKISKLFNRKIKEIAKESKTKIWGGLPYEIR